MDIYYFKDKSYEDAKIGKKKEKQVAGLWLPQAFFSQHDLEETIFTRKL